MSTWGPTRARRLDILVTIMTKHIYISFNPLTHHMTAALTNCPVGQNRNQSDELSTFSFRLRKPSKIIRKGNSSLDETCDNTQSQSASHPHQGILKNSEAITMSTAELASSYAALILADDGVEITVSFQASNQLDPASASVLVVGERLGASGRGQRAGIRSGSTS